MLPDNFVKATHEDALAGALALALDQPTGIGWKTALDLRSIACAQRQDKPISVEELVRVRTYRGETQGRTAVESTGEQITWSSEVVVRQDPLSALNPSLAGGSLIRAQDHRPIGVTSTGASLAVAH